MFGDERLPERFWAKVQIAPSGCWEWTGAKVRDGYGSFRHTFSTLPHRIAYRFLVGEIPEGYEVDHLCRNTSCCNPAHLEPVTPRVNALRSTNVAAHYAQRTHCKWGHAFTPENTAKVDGTRHCLTCRSHGRLKQTQDRRARTLSKNSPEMVCACGWATPLSEAQWRWLERIFCVFCGEQLKGNKERIGWREAS